MTAFLRLFTVTFLLIMGSLAIVWAQPVWGPQPPGQAPKNAPVLGAALVQASPNSSPIPAGRVVTLAADSYGRLMVTSSGSSSGNVTLQPGTQAANVTLPAASPVAVLVQPSPVIVVPGATALNVLVQPSPVVVVPGSTALNVALPASSPIPVRIDSSASSTGYSWYCSPQFGGGSSEVTIKGSAGLLLGGSVSTNSTSDIYLLGWDASNPTPGTTAPLFSLMIPASPTGTSRACYDFWLPAPGLQFSTALTVTTVTAANGSSTPSGNTTLNLAYK